MALAAKTAVSENSFMSANLPDLRPASMHIKMKDGSRLAKKLRPIVEIGWTHTIVIN